MAVTQLLDPCRQHGLLWNEAQNNALNLLKLESDAQVESSSMRPATGVAAL